MKLFSKLKNNNQINEETLVNVDDNKNDLSIIETANYMLTDVRKESIKNKGFSLTLTKMAELSPALSPATENIKNIVKNNKSKGTTNLYRVVNLGKNDSLKAMKDGKTFWGAIKKSDKTSTMAQLKKVNPNTITEIDPAMIMMSVALSGIENEMSEIKELNKKILSFLEYDKEAEIEADLEILNKSISDFRFNLNDEKYILNNYKQIMDIKRTANKNMIFYQKQVKEDLTKDKFVTTNASMNSMIEDIEKKFKYYRLSLYIYSYSSLLETLLLGNFQNAFLISKQNELDALDSEYANCYNEALEYIKKNANKLLEGNLLSGLGSAGKTIGNLIEKTKVKNVDTWLNEKGSNLKQSAQNIKDNYVLKFEEVKSSNLDTFKTQIEKIDVIYNKTKEIYFDDENIYLTQD